MTDSSASHQRICVWCSSQMIFKKKLCDASLYRCVSCQSEYAHPHRPQSYKADYFSAYQDEQRERVFRCKKKQSDELLARYCGTKIEGKLLDVGCGVGALLAAAEDRGCDELYGVDISSWAIEQARAHTKKAQCIVGDVTTALTDDLQGVPFDIITALDVVEHLENPISFFELLFSALTDTGKILIIIPNVTGFSHHVMGTFWHLYQDGHMHFASSAGLQHVMRARGGHIRSIAPAWKTLPVGYLFGVLQFVEHPCVQKIGTFLNWCVRRLRVSSCAVSLPTGELVMEITR